MPGVRGEDLAEFFLGSRAENTMRSYESAFKWVKRKEERLGYSVFKWGEGEMAGAVVELAKEKRG